LDPPALPQSLARFIRNEIHSVSQLEVLLLLRERGGQWSAVAVAEELRITPQSAELRLHDLSRRGLLKHHGEPESFAYVPRAPQLCAQVDDLAATYAERRYAVIDLIFSVSDDSARAWTGPHRFRTKTRDP
jgi:predicted ArsR family transcriptional regulator